MIYDLPMSLCVNGQERAINADFRDIIIICNALNDEELTARDKNYILLNNLYKDDIQDLGNTTEAIKQAIWFIDWGKEYKEQNEQPPRLLDWEKDYNSVIAAVNNKVKTVEDVRELPFLHWWTFLGYFAERGKCQISTILEIRDKLAHGKKLEKWEEEILRENRDDIILKTDFDLELEKEIWGE